MRGPQAASLALAVALLASALAQAEPALQVAGSVVATTPRLQVSVVVTNPGDRPVSSLEITGDLLGQHQEAAISSVAAGGSSTALLDFDTAGAGAGSHALVLMLEHPIDGAPDAAGNPPLASQRSWLLIALGAHATPAVRLAPKPCLLAVTGRLEVVITSTDGADHRVRLRAFVPRGLRSDGDGVRVDVPARGAVTAALPLVRAGAERGTQHDVVVIAETTDEPLVRTSGATAQVQVATDPSLLPRARSAILALGGLLLGVALGVETWSRLRTLLAT